MSSDCPPFSVKHLDITYKKFVIVKVLIRCFFWLQFFNPLSKKLTKIYIYFLNQLFKNDKHSYEFYCKFFVVLFFEVGVWKILIFWKNLLDDLSHQGADHCRSPLLPLGAFRSDWCCGYYLRLDWETLTIELNFPFFLGWAYSKEARKFFMIISRVRNLFYYFNKEISVFYTA